MKNDTTALCGIRIIEDLYVPEFTYKKVKRSWKERLFTRPFKPFLAYKEVKDERCIIRHQFGIICHPSTAMAIRAQIGD